MAETALSPSELTWNNRVVIISEDIEGSVLFAQYDLLKEAIPEFLERDVIILSVKEGSARIRSDFNQPNLNFSNPNDWNIWVEQYLLKSDDGGVLLIGKDSGLKKVWQEHQMPVAPQEIFEIIDSMPMRQQEMMIKNKK